MKMGEQFNAQEGAAIALLCARCKIPVKAGISHQCEEDLYHDESNQTRKDAHQEKPD